MSLCSLRRWLCVLAAAVMVCVPVTAFHVYPTIMPLPQQFTQTSPGYSVRVVDPAKVHVSIEPANGKAASGASVQLLQRGAKRFASSLTQGINATTLPWLKVRLPPLQNSSNPADAFPSASGAMDAVKIVVEDLATQPRCAGVVAFAFTHFS